MESFETNHWIGFTNIEKSLENYEGEMRTDYTKEFFQ